MKTMTVIGSTLIAAVLTGGGLTILETIRREQPPAAADSSRPAPIAALDGHPAVPTPEIASRPDFGGLPATETVTSQSPAPIPSSAPLVALETRERPAGTRIPPIHAPVVITDVYRQGDRDVVAFGGKWNGGTLVLGYSDGTHLMPCYVTDGQWGAADPGTCYGYIPRSGGTPLAFIWYASDCCLRERAVWRAE